MTLEDSLEALIHHLFWVSKTPQVGGSLPAEFSSLMLVAMIGWPAMLHEGIGTISTEVGSGSCFEILLRLFVAMASLL